MLSIPKGVWKPENAKKVFVFSMEMQFFVLSRS